MDLRISDRNPQYKSAVEWLHQFANLQQMQRRTPTGEYIIRELVQTLVRYPCIIVAGTKGKGSTASMIEGILRACGLKTGLFTSPHLHSFRERIQVNRVPISSADFVSTLGLFRASFDWIISRDPHPFTFELTLALSLIYFEQSAVDIAIYEVGCGGQSDPVNLLSPCLCAITSISMDHMDIFGNSLSRIAEEKAGIIRHNVPIVSSEQDPAVSQIIAARARKCAAPLWYAKVQFIENDDSTVIPYPVRIHSSTVGLKGEFQLENARVAVTAATILKSHSIPITLCGIRQGLATVSWPARVEMICLAPKVVVDGAHNEDSIRKLMLAVRELWHFRRLILILGISKTKDINGIVHALANYPHLVIATSAIDERAAEPALLIDYLREFTNTSVLPSVSVTDAIPMALERAEKNDLICITGSLLVASEAREFFGKGERD